jgi:hypothetical protein
VSYDATLPVPQATAAGEAARATAGLYVVLLAREYLSPPHLSQH